MFTYRLKFIKFIFVFAVKKFFTSRANLLAINNASAFGIIDLWENVFSIQIYLRIAGLTSKANRIRT